jgi:hypothetical protein
MRCAVASLLAGAAVAAALVWGGDDGGSGAAQAAAPPSATFVRTCDAGSSVPAHPVRRQDLRAGPIRVMGARKLARARARSLYSWPGTRLRVIKAPVVITGARAVTVAVASRDRDVLGLVFDVERRSPRTVAGADAVVTFEVCPREGRITGYPGGLVYGGRWKRCVELEFWVEGRSRPIRRRVSLGAGRRCG